jgi:hypothetical protein
MKKFVIGLFLTLISQIMSEAQNVNNNAVNNNNNSQSNSNIVIVNPSTPTLNDNNIMITFDATRGNGSLAGFQQDIYIHTGVLTNHSSSPSDWKYIKTKWGQADSRWKMTSIGNNKYSFNIGNIRQFYGIPNNEVILKLAFVFRNANASIIAKNADNSDIFIPISNTAENNSSSSNNVIVNNNSSAQSNSTVNNNGNGQTGNNPNAQGNKNIPPNKISFSILENGNPNDNLGFILSSGQDLLILSGQKNAKGELVILENVKWGTNDGKYWASIDFSKSGLPEYLTYSDGTQMSFSNFTSNSFDIETHDNDGNIKRTNQTIPYNIPKEADILIKNMATSRMSRCQAVGSSKAGCNDVSTTIKSSLFMANAIMCGIETVKAAMVPLPVQGKIIYVGITLISCGLTVVKDGVDLFNRLVDCDKIKYAKINLGLPKPILDLLEDVSLKTKSEYDKQKEGIEGGTTNSRKSTARNNLRNVMTAGLMKLADKIADFLDKPKIQNNQLPNCKPPLPAGFNINVHSVFLNPNYAGYAVLSDNKSATLKFTYTKSNHDIEAIIHFYDQSNNLLTTIQKNFTASQTKGEFSLKITEIRAPNCRSYPGMGMMSMQYFASNNFDHTFIRIQVIYNGEKYWVGKDVGYYDNRGGLELVGKGDSKTPVCSYSVSE